MRKITALFFMALFLSCMITHSASRPKPVFNEILHHQDAEEVDESCKGLSEEQCLMRRTLTAHLDYIYTQDQNP
ncbi:hypothetical protein VNO78_08052 [Psophocarpus tetragonolobus]|uniref:Phytosulfokine n=1 Tax=Psophocarpus tetragonolobus TaxID=3891 RepID=A0AAN9T4D0_PSOTE